MAGGNKSNGGKKGSVKSRPSSTSQLAVPLDTSQNTSQNVLSSFSPSNDWFACLTQSVDRHRLQVYTCDEQSRLLADYIVPNAKCGCLEWLSLPSSSSAASSSLQQSSKKRRKRQSLDGVEGEQEGAVSAPQEVLALGLSTGSIHLFNPLQGKVVRILSNAVNSSSNATLSLTYSNTTSTLFACLQDGSVCSWDLKEVVAQSAATPIMPTDELTSLVNVSNPFRQLRMLSPDLIALAHHSIAVYSLSQQQVIATYTGHASNVTHLIPLSGSPARFVSAAEGDRVVTVWLAPLEGRKTAKPLATLPLEAPVSHLCATSDDAGKDVIAIVTLKGSVRLYEVPLVLDGSASAKGKKSGGIATLPLLTEVTIVAKEGNREELPALNAQLGKQGKVKVARMAKGAKVAFEEASAQDGSGNFKSKLTIVRGQTAIEGSNAEHLGGSASTLRYTEAGRSAAQRSVQSASVTGANGLLTGPDDVGELDDDQANLDASIQDLEEPSLGQRLKGLRVGAGVNGVVDEDDEEEREAAALPMGSLSLGQTLTQALHSNDAALLSSCLAHSDPNVVRSSVSRLNGPLAVKLLEHCVDRMGRSGKKSAGALGSARTRGIIEWVRATLVAHTGYLMSLPNLVHRLSSLHSTLSSRLASHERLLALNGRLELVLGQIEMRAAYTSEQAVKVQGVKAKGRRGDASEREANKRMAEGRQWVEESSSEEEDREEMEVDEDEDGNGLDDVVQGEEEGDVQEIALGNDTLANTSVDSDEEDESDEEMGEEGDEESGEEASDESELDEEGDSEEVEDEEEEDSNGEDGRGGLLDLEAESTDGEGSEESDESEE